MKTLFLCGAGNPEGVRLARKVNRAQKRWDRMVLLDDSPAKHGASILGVEISGPFSLLAEADRASCEVVNLVARTTRKRRAAREAISAYGLPLVSLIDPECDLEGVHVEGDITVYRNVSFCTEASMASGCVAFTGSVIGHGSRIAVGCVVAPGAVINARVRLEEGVYVGSNASILPDITVKAWATIGANSAVVQDVPGGSTVVGVPAQILIPGKSATDDLTAIGSLVDEPARPDSRGGPSGRTQPFSDGLKRLRVAQCDFLRTHSEPGA